MADVSEVLDVVRNAAAVALYPGGVPAGGVSPVIGARARVFVGWPMEGDLPALEAGAVYVTIWPRGGVTRDIGPYLGRWREPGPAPSLTVAVDEPARTVTFGGDAAVPRMIAAVVVDGALGYTHPVLTTDTPAIVAQALADAILADLPGTSAAGPVLTVPSASRLRARVVAGGTSGRELRRVEQGIDVSVWAASSHKRDVAAAAIDQALLARRRLPLPDGTTAFLRYEGTSFDEGGRAVPVHRRAVLMSVEYGTHLLSQGTPVAVAEGIVERPPNPPHARVTRVVIT